MTANRVLTNHEELEKIGDLTHDQIDNAITGSSFILVSQETNLGAARTLTAGTGVFFIDSGAGNAFTVNVDNSVVATLTGSIFTGVASFNSGLSGSLTRLTDGTSFIRAGSNVTIASESNGSITISSTASGSTESTFVENEVPSGAVNGTNNSFELELIPNPSSSLRLFKNGLRMLDNNDFTITGSTINFNQEQIPTSGSNILADYRLEAGSFIENEIPAGSVDGANDTFTLIQTPSPTKSLKLYKRGLRMFEGAGNDFILSGSTITFSSEQIPTTGSIILADYRV